MASLLDSFDKTNLDLENAGVLGGPNKDLQTQYPATSTGTPTTQANPGPTKNFVPKFTPTSTYLNQVVGSSNMLQLASSLNRTNLDVENPGVSGGPNKDTSTIYPSDVTGTPTIDRNPVGPPTNFNQKYTPTNKYINQINNKIIPNSALSNNAESPKILKITNLDVEDSNVNGGPNKDITTVYPPLVSGTPSTAQNPSEAPKNFDQLYSPSNTYLSNLNSRNKTIANSALSNDAESPKILDITNLDNSKDGVIEYKADISDPTEYPVTSTGRTEIRAWSPTIPGATSTISQKFDTKYNPIQKYNSVPEVDNGNPVQVDEINIDEAKLKKIGNEISAEADRALKKGKGFVDSLTSFFGKI